MEARSKRNSESGRRVGSALILTVLLTSLLAIVGVLFVLLTRMDKLSASARIGPGYAGGEKGDRPD
jgi:hypothetical protein